MCGSICPHVCLLANGSEGKSLTEWTDRLAVCVLDSLALYVCMCGCVLLLNKDGGCVNVCTAAARVEVYSHISPTV